MDLKIGSINVRGLGDQVKRREIFNWLRAKKNIHYIIYADTLKVSSGALIEVTLLFRYSTTGREPTRVLALFGHLSEWQFN